MNIKIMLATLVLVVTEASSLKALSVICDPAGFVREKDGSVVFINDQTALVRLKRLQTEIETKGNDPQQVLALVIAERVMNHENLEQVEVRNIIPELQIIDKSL